MNEITNNEIHVTRGNMKDIDVTASIPMETDEEIVATPYTFQVDDVIRLKVMEKGKCENVLIEKDVLIEEETDIVTVHLTSSETKIGEIISKPKTYWYEVELNPDTERTQTIIGYDKKTGPKLFILYPEGGDK